MAKRKSKAPPAAVVAGPKKMGAPVIQIDMDQLRTFCKLKPTVEDCSSFFKCSIDTIERRVREATGLTFTEFRAQSLVHTKFDLMRRAIEKAKNGDNDMIKYCLKNLSDWSDRGEAPAVDVNITNNVAVKVQRIDIEERIELIKDK